MLAKAGRLVRKALFFSLADPVFSSGKVVCISLERDGVYLVCTEKTLWKVNVRHCKYYPLPENQILSPEYAAASVSAFVKDFKISNATFILGLPRSWAIVQNVPLPLAAKEDLSRVVAFELDRLTPLSRDNAYYDYVVQAEDDQSIKILLVVVRADQINAYLSALETKGAQIKRIGLTVFMVRSLIRNTYPNIDTVFISLKDGVYEGGIILNTLTAQSYTGSVDINDQTAVAEMAGHIQLLMNELTANSSPPRIVVNADESAYCVLRDKFRPVTVSALMSDLKCDVPEQRRELSAGALGGALGAFSESSDSIDLLAKKDRSNPQMPWLSSVLLLIPILAIAVFCLLAPVHFQQQKIDALGRHIQTLKPEVRKIEALQSEIDLLESDIEAINHFKRQNDLTMNVLRDMTTTLPPRSWLTRLRITDAAAEIEGYSASATDIILKLESSKYFQKVEFGSPTFRDPRLNTERFVIKMELKNGLLKYDRRTEINNEKKK